MEFVLYTKPPVSHEPLISIIGSSNIFMFFYFQLAQLIVNAGGVGALVDYVNEARGNSRLPGSGSDFLWFYFWSFEIWFYFGVKCLALYC